MSLLVRDSGSVIFGNYVSLPNFPEGRLLTVILEFELEVAVLHDILPHTTITITLPMNNIQRRMSDVKSISSCRYGYFPPRELLVRTSLN